jgi:hypothetical protein
MDDHFVERDFVERRDVTQWLDYMTGRLDEYEVERNEYLAAYREQAPASFRFFQDVVLGFAENALLMDNIAAGREEIQYVRNEENGVPQDRLRIHTIINGSEIKARYPDAEALTRGDPSDEDSICYPDNFPYLLRHCNFTERNPSKCNLRQALNNKDIQGEDIEVVLPNLHTFYSILENFIRNSAKHSKHLSSKKKLDIYISIIDPGPEAESYDVILGDNASEVTVEDAVNFQCRIEEDLLGLDAERKETSLGIADMKFSSFLMCDPNPGQMDETKLSKHLSIVAFRDKIGKVNQKKDYIVLGQDEDNEGDGEARVEDLKEDLRADTCNFGYRFRLVKSKKVCWIGSYLDEHEAELRRHGIYRYPSLNKFQNPDGQRTIAAFDFAVIEQAALAEANEAEFERTLLQLPYRVLLVRSGDGESDDEPVWLSDFLAENERRVQRVKDLPTMQREPDGPKAHDHLLRWCWCEWLKRWGIGDDRGAQVHIYTEAETGVERWHPEQNEDALKEDGNSKIAVLSSGSAELIAVSEKERDNHRETPSADSTALIVYDRHGGLLKHGFKNAEDREKARERFQNPAHFCNSFDKNSRDFSYLFYPAKRQESKEHRIHQLIEAGLLRVLVLDERIAKLAEKNPHASMSSALPTGRENFWYQAAAANVFLVTKVEGSKVAERSSADDMFVDLTLNVDGPLSLSHGGEELSFSEYADVIVIHRTFAKSLSEQLGCEVKTFIGRLREKIPWVIVDSGTSHSLDEKAQFKFLPFSQLEKQIEQVGSGCVLSKVQLVKRIMTLTRTHE